MLRKSGRRAFVCGNVGVPLSQTVREAGTGDLLVVEVSSFQLESIVEFRPWIAVILNIEGDHLERYGNDITRYRETKARVLANQSSDDFAVLNRDDPLVRGLERYTRAKVIPFSLRETPREGVFLREGKIVCRNGGKETILAAADKIKLSGEHNRENVLAAVAVASICGAERSQVEAGLSSFSGLPHCLEEVGSLRGIRFINDSKATNPAAMRRAMETLSGPFVLIAGGRDKGNDFHPLADLVNRKVRVVLLLGEASEKIREAWRGRTHFLPVANMKEAVRKGFREARNHEVVLLSPGCASFDQYGNFRERGEDFRRAVKELIPEGTTSSSSPLVGEG